MSGDGREPNGGTNIGVDPSQIAMHTKQTLDDAIWWHNNDVFDADERAVRIHRRLVAVHPFPNGNGRCTRLLADLYLTAIGHPIFTWGAGGNLDEDGDVRRRYLEAPHAADADDYGPLVVFARA
jgi:Fic-DOC domain mobile mystery protein B